MIITVLKLAVRTQPTGEIVKILSKIPEAVSSQPPLEKYPSRPASGYQLIFSKPNTGKAQR